MQVPKHYIACTDDLAIPYIEQQKQIARTPCRVDVLDTDHSPFYSKQEELVGLLTLEEDVRVALERLADPEAIYLKTEKLLEQLDENSGL